MSKQYTNLCQIRCDRGTLGIGGRRGSKSRLLFALASPGALSLLCSAGPLGPRSTHPPGAESLSLAGQEVRVSGGSPLDETKMVEMPRVFLSCATDIRSTGQTPEERRAESPFLCSDRRWRLLVRSYRPTVSPDIISLVTSSCGYYRGHIEQRAAH